MPAGKLERTGSHKQADERLLVQAAQRDPERFGELYELHFDAVYAFIARRVHDRDVAEDLTGGRFLQSARGSSSFRLARCSVWSLALSNRSQPDCRSLEGFGKRNAASKTRAG